MEIEHLGYLIKSDDNTYEITLKPKQTINDEDVCKKIEDFFDTFFVKVNVVTLVKVATGESHIEKRNKRDYYMLSLEKRQFVITHFLLVKFTVRDYIDYYIGQGGRDGKPFQSNFYATIKPLIDEGRVKDTGLKKGKAILYERIKEEDEGQPGDANEVLILDDHRKYLWITFQEIDIDEYYRSLTRRGISSENRKIW